MKKYFETPTQVMFWQDTEIMHENNVDYCFSCGAKMDGDDTYD